MEVLSFDISGKFAHFRKFHANNTAMSYSIPPRTTLTGMMAAILGREKNSYYSEFSDENLKVGIRVLSDIRKSFHRLNYLMIKSKEDFTGRNGRVQTPFEVVTGNSLGADSVRYRVFVAAGENDEVYKELKKALTEDGQHFNLSLGPANFVGFLSEIKIYGKVQRRQIEDEFTEIHSACNSEQVSEIDFPKEEAALKFNFIEEELLPADFIADHNRELKHMNRVLFATRDFPLRVRLTGAVYELGEGEELQRIQFLQYAGMVAQ